MSSENIHTVYDRLLGREAKEKMLSQHGCVVWLFGLSGSGKSTIADSLERKLHSKGYYTQLLDGDNVRDGLNSDLGFSDSDRAENIRRIAEVAKLHATAGIVTIVSFITPYEELRKSAQQIIGKDYISVYIKCSFEECAKRDPKGLYAKALNGEIKDFTGKDSLFHEPESTDLTVDTESVSLEDAVARIYDFIKPKIAFNAA